MLQLLFFVKLPEKCTANPQNSPQYHLIACSIWPRKASADGTRKRLMCDVRGVRRRKSNLATVHLRTPCSSRLRSYIKATTSVALCELHSIVLAALGRAGTLATLQYTDPAGSTDVRCTPCKPRSTYLPRRKRDARFVVHSDHQPFRGHCTT